MPPKSHLSKPLTSPKFGGQGGPKFSDRVVKITFETLFKQTIKPD